MALDLNNPETWFILLVDDNPDNLEMAADVFRFFGSCVICANNGQETFDLLTHHQPNLIILDLLMPDPDGWELHQQLRAREALIDVPIIALSAQAMVGDRERVLAAGFNGYISKPIYVNSIIQDIRNCIVHKPA
jgi:CheY-like chemotaxis protein